MIYLILIILLLSFLFLFVKGNQYQKFFDEWGIPHPEEVPFLGLFGLNFFKQVPMNILAKELYNLNKNAKYVGFRMLLTPGIVVRDLDLIKSVLVKNFDHFADHKKVVDEESDPLFGKNLAFLNGDRWKQVRNFLSPSFTSSKLRTMFELMSSCADNFSKHFVKSYASAEAVDMKDIFTRYTNDVIATCAFGIEVDSLKDPENDFYLYGKLATTVDFATFFKFFLLRTFPKLSQKFNLRIISKKVTDFFVNVIDTTIKIRDQQGITRPDMLQLMMDAREKNLNMSLDLLEITSQAFIFFLGGLGTTSDMLCMIFYELAVNQDVQKKLLDEIDGAMKESNGKPSYESINGMQYLDAVITETLRMHPMGFLTRVCTKEFEFPPALPGSKPFLVKPDMEILIPVAGVHDDPVYYPRPEKFDPERHSDKKSITSDALSLGFGLGPRVCIGNRFAVLEVKAVMVHLLAKCSVEPCEKTCIPLEYEKGNFAPAVKGGCWLKIAPR